MTYVGTPPRVTSWRPQRDGSATEERARRHEIALAYEEREKLELLFYGAEATWQNAFAALRAARDSAGTIAARRARYQLRLADTEIRGAYRRLLDVHRRLQSLLAEERDVS